MNSDQNPFCARRLRPGTVPFQFAPGQSVEQLIERLGQSGWRGQIVGPHGSGKSTLLAALAPAIERAGIAVMKVELHDGQRRLPEANFEIRSTKSQTNPNDEKDSDQNGVQPAVLLAIDGYEQLNFWNRFWVRRLCRRRGLGLVVTAHAPAGLPELFQTVVDVALAWQVVALLQQGHQSLATPEDVADRLACHAGNLRETLFELFDVYEERRRRGPPSTASPCSAYSPTEGLTPLP